MKIMNKSDFLQKSTETLGEIFDMISELPVLQVKDLPKRQTVLVIVDMINGFAREGVLKSPRVEELIPEITGLAKICDQLEIPKLAFADCHSESSPEFQAYPAHCMAGTHEGEIVDEIKAIGGYQLIAKNSTNGCIQQFAITLKTWFNMQDKLVRIIVPANAVDTYDLGLHNGDLMNVMALYNMMMNGVEVVKALD